VLITPLGELELVNALQLPLFRKEIQLPNIAITTDRQHYTCRGEDQLDNAIDTNPWTATSLAKSG
jgi:hypothetical protein